MNKLFFFLLFPFSLCMGQLPDTDLWLFRLAQSKGKWSAEKGQNITLRPGYDNQPQFSSNGKSVYYVSVREDRQADVFRYDISSGKRVQITKTAESEYSPTLSPDAKALICVSVLADSSQVLAALDLKTLKAESLPRSRALTRFTNIDSVGYFTFLNSDTILYYKLIKPATLFAYSVRTGAEVRIADHPGRGFKAVNRHAFVFGVKDSTAMSFFIYDALLYKAKSHARYASLSEDILWHPEWGLLKAEKSAIFRYDEQKQEWASLFDFSAYGIKTITRFQIDPSNKYLVLTETK